MDPLGLVSKRQIAKMAYGQLYYAENLQLLACTSGVSRVIEKSALLLFDMGLLPSGNLT